MTKEDLNVQDSESGGSVNISGVYLSILLDRIMEFVTEGGGIGVIGNTPIGCSICGESNAGSVKLIGEYNTVLCNEHRNEWHVYVNTSIELQSYESITVRLDIAIRKQDEILALGLSKGARDAKMALYELGKDWVSRKAKKVEDK